MPKNVKFPLCSKYDITLTKKGYCEICGDAITACAEEVELALSKAEEQGKLDLVELLADFWYNNKKQWSKEYALAYEDCYDWLKSQLKSSKGEQGVIPLKPLGVSADVAKRNAGSPRNPESLKKVVFTKEEYLEELDRNG